MAEPKSRKVLVLNLLENVSVAALYRKRGPLEMPDSVTRNVLRSALRWIMVRPNTVPPEPEPGSSVRIDNVPEPRSIWRNGVQPEPLKMVVTSPLPAAPRATSHEPPS